jgi:hypothetical protein
MEACIRTVCLIVLVLMNFIEIVSGTAIDQQDVQKVDVSDYSAMFNSEHQRLSDLSIIASESSVTLHWTQTGYPSFYKVYSCSTPYGLFCEDLSGNFSSVSWTAPITGIRQFYYVTSEMKILIIEAVDSYGSPLPALVFRNNSCIGYAPLTLEGYAPGTYYVWCPPPHPDGSYIWEPSEVILSDNYTDRHLIFTGFYWLK